MRQQQAGPLLDELQQWLTTTLRLVSKKSELAGAISYALVRWVALTRYRDDGRIEIDNNAAERAIRRWSWGDELPLRRLRRWRRAGRDIYS